MNDTIDILKQLISIPSYIDSDHNENELCLFVEDFLKTNTNLIIEKQVVESNRFNIIAKGKSNPEIILFGHLDTVLPKNETTDPFIPRTDGNKLYGLGSVDMKSGLAIMLDIASKYKSDKLGFVFSVDEEYDFKGAIKLKEISDLHPKFIINVEPTSGKILNGCRGITEFSFDLIGKSAHAGRKQLGINAIESVINISNYLQQEVAQFDTEEAMSSVNLAYLHGGILDKMENGEPVVKRMGNVVPDYAKAIIEIRIGSSKITPDFVTNLLNQKSAEIGTRLENLKFKFYLGSMFTPKENLAPFEKALFDSGQKPEYESINSSGFFELQMLQEKWGGNCFVYGAGPGSLSHAANEYVDLDTLKTAQTVIEKFLESTLK